MDFNIVKRQIISAYLSIYGTDNSDKQWSLGDCLDVFRYYYRAYKAKFKRDHPKLKTSTIKEIIYALPEAVDEDTDTTFDLDPTDYPDLIKVYFKSTFAEGCDYSIAHFMSGKIRLMKYYEALY